MLNEITNVDSSLKITNVDSSLKILHPFLASVKNIDSIEVNKFYFLNRQKIIIDKSIPNQLIIIDKKKKYSLVFILGLSTFQKRILICKLG